MEKAYTLNVLRALGTPFYSLNGDVKDEPKNYNELPEGVKEGIASTEILILRSENKSPFGKDELYEELEEKELKGIKDLIHQYVPFLKINI